MIKIIVHGELERIQKETTGHFTILSH